MNLRVLEMLIAVADAGSFAAAADRVGVTQSAISMQMKALEEDLGATLFDRSRRPPILNETGRRIVEGARDMVRLEQSLRALAAGSRVRGRFRLGVIPTAATGLVPDALARLAARAPELQIRIESGLSADLTRRVAQGVLDAAVITETARLERGLSVRTILEEPLVVAVPRSILTAHRLQQAEQGRLGSGSEPGVGQGNAALARMLLRERPFVRFNRRTGVGRVIDSALRQMRIPVSEAMELDSIEAILAMVGRGLGVAVVPESAVAAYPSDTLVSLSFGDRPVYRRVGLVERDRVTDRPPHALTPGIAEVSGPTDLLFEELRHD